MLNKIRRIPSRNDLSELIIVSPSFIKFVFFS